MMTKAFVPLAAELLIYSIFYNFLPDLFGINIVTAIVWWLSYFLSFIIFNFVGL